MDRHVVWIALLFALATTAIVTFGLHSQERYLAAQAAEAAGQPLPESDWQAWLRAHIEPELRGTLMTLCWGAAAASIGWILLLGFQEEMRSGPIQYWNWRARLFWAGLGASQSYLPLALLALALGSVVLLASLGSR
jgi:hypothetical protein